MPKVCRSRSTGHGWTPGHAVDGYRVNYNGQQVSQTFATLREANDWLRRSEGTGSSWLEFHNWEGDEWFPVPGSRGGFADMGLARPARRGHGRRADGGGGGGGAGGKRCRRPNGHFMTCTKRGRGRRARGRVPDGPPRSDQWTRYDYPSERQRHHAWLSLDGWRYDIYGDERGVWRMVVVAPAGAPKFAKEAAHRVADERFLSLDAAVDVARGHYRYRKVNWSKLASTPVFKRCR